MKRKRTIPLIVSLLIMTGCEHMTNFETLKVESCYPSNHQYGVSTGESVVIGFNNDVKKSDIEKQFALSGDSGTVEGTVTWNSGKKFTYTPRYGLDVGSRYIIEIPRTVEDRHGNKMEMDFLSEFYVGDDLQKPSVVSSVPVYTPGGTADVPVDQNIVINFSEAMNHIKTESAFSISPGVSGHLTWNAESTQMIYMFSTDLALGVQYTVTVSTNAEDVSGNTLGSTYRVIFITGSDFISPTITGVNISGAPVPPYWDPDTTTIDISKFADIAVYFSEAMNINTTESAFSITPSISGTLTWNAGRDVMTFSPESPMGTEILYTLRIATTAKDAKGLTLQDEYIVRFKTSANDSKYIQVGEVEGSNDDAVYALLFTTTPPWPVSIEMGPAGEDDYYFQIAFVNENGPVVMDTFSIYDNITIEGFDPSFTPSISDITWLSGNTILRVALDGLSNELDAGVTPVLFRLTINGGEYGVKDEKGNPMQDTFSFEFRE
jgi:hypothetical protein